MSKRKKLRKLVIEDEPATKASVLTMKSIIFRTISVCLLIAILSGLVTHSYLIDEFITNYHEQYHLIVHGTSNYCTQFFNYKDLLTVLREYIFGQENALSALETVLRSHENFTAIAIVGTTGIGKTLLMNLLRKHFPWRDNVQHYAWSTYDDEHDKLLYIDEFLRKLSDCGHNIILIDDILPKDKRQILDIHKKAEVIISTGIHKLIVFYVFNISRYSKKAQLDYDENVKNLQNLDTINIINFKHLNSVDVEKCIRFQSKVLDMKLSNQDVNEIVRLIDVLHVGCKNVHSRMTQYKNLYE